MGGADLADVKDKLAKLGITVGDDENLYSYTDASAEVHIAREADIRKLTKVTAEGTENVLKGYNYNGVYSFRVYVNILPLVIFPYINSGFY